MLNVSRVLGRGVHIAAPVEERVSAGLVVNCHVKFRRQQRVTRCAGRTPGLPGVGRADQTDQDRLKLLHGEQTWSSQAAVRDGNELSHRPDGGP